MVAECEERLDLDKAQRGGPRMRRISDSDSERGPSESVLEAPLDVEAFAFRSALRSLKHFFRNALRTPRPISPGPSAGTPHAVPCGPRGGAHLPLRGNRRRGEREGAQLLLKY